MEILYNGTTSFSVGDTAKLKNKKGVLCKYLDTLYFSNPKLMSKTGFRGYSIIENEEEHIFLKHTRYVLFEKINEEFKNRN